MVRGCKLPSQLLNSPVSIRIPPGSIRRHASGGLVGGHGKLGISDPSERHFSIVVSAVVGILSVNKLAKSLRMHRRTLSVAGT